MRLAALCAALALAAPAHADEAASSSAPPEPTWQFSFAPYLWASGLEGTVEADGTTADVDISFSDIWDALDAGLLGQFEARRGKLSLVSNGIYLKLTDSASGVTSPVLPAAPPGSYDVRFRSELGMLELRPTWEVLSLPLGANDERRIALDLGPGARAFWMEQSIHAKLKPGVPVGPFSRRFDGSTEWVDWLAAGRVRIRLTENLGLALSGDYGGFDIGSSSHRTWSLGGVFAYRLGEHWDLALGWRELEVERGAIDLEMSGPLVGTNYRF